jgi:hypothetical protein
MGVTIHYRGQLADLGKLNILCDELTQVAEKMDFLNGKMDAMRGELSRVTGNHLTRLSPEELASMIEALLKHKFSDQDD